jgi:hypothetical protein
MLLVWFSQLGLVAAWVGLGRTMAPLRLGVPLLMLALLWAPYQAVQQPSLLGWLGTWFWPYRHGESALFVELGYTPVVLAMLSTMALLLTCLVAGLLGLVRLAGLRVVRIGEQSAGRRWQFSLGRLLAGTAAVAVDVALARSFAAPLWNGLADLAHVDIDEPVIWWAYARPTLIPLSALLGGVWLVRLRWIGWPRAVVIAVLSTAATAFLFRLGEINLSVGLSLLGAALIPPAVVLGSLLVVRGAGYRLAWRSGRPAQGEAI